MKLLILTTDPTLLSWESLAFKREAILKALNSGIGAKWSVDIAYRPDIKPLVLDGKIDHSWLFNLVTPFHNITEEGRMGYDMVVLHSSEKQWQDWGIVGVRGVNPNRIGSYVEDMYFSADERSKRNGFDRFVQVCLHEISHGYYDHSGEKDITHSFHDMWGDISELFEEFDWSKWQPVRQNQKKQITLLSKVVDLYTQLQAKRAGLQPCVYVGAENIIKVMKEKGYPVRITQGYRSKEEQDKLYAQGRTTKGSIVTNAKGGESFHQYGVAVDFVFIKEGYLATNYMWGLLGRVGKEQGFEWGGDWKSFVDKPHFQMTKGHTLKDFQKGLVDYNKFK